MYGKVQRVCLAYQIVFPFTHFLPTPTHHSIVINRQGFIRDNQILVYTDNLPKSLTSGTCTHRIIKVKHQLARLVECDTVCLEPFRKTKLPYFFAVINQNDTLSPTFKKGSLDRIGQSADCIGLMRNTHSVYYQTDSVGLR